MKRTAEDSKLRRQDTMSYSTTCYMQNTEKHKEELIQNMSMLLSYLKNKEKQRELMKLIIII